MITGEYFAVFKLIDEASPALGRLLLQIRELTAAVDKAKLNIASIGAMPSLTAAIAETSKLAQTWRGIADYDARTSRAGRGGGGGGSGPGPSPTFSLPGTGIVGDIALAGAGAAYYSVAQAAKVEDAVWQLIYHSGREQNDDNRGKFRKILQDSMAESGYGLHDISESAKQEIRMFQGTPGNGIDVLPEMLRAATIESRLKGESPEESMKALIGLAHMTKEYSPEAIRKLAPAFAFISTANPGSLSSIEKAAGYAVPLLQSGLDIDPMESLLLGTALTRAGATSTKSGTWLREMALRAMPGTSMMSKIAFKKHEEALKAFGLVGDDDKPTWLTNGRPDIFKMLDIAGGRANSIPLEKRAAYERSLFGAQGGGFALLSDPKVREQVQALQGEMNSPEFKARYGGFVQAYQQGSTVQNARTALAEFNNLAADLGQHLLPAVNGALREFKSVLEAVRGVIPGASTDKGAALIGTRALEGAAIVGGVGLFGGPATAAAGAAVGGIAGGVEGVVEQFMRTEVERERQMSQEEQLRAAQALAGGIVQPVKFQIDGHTIGEVMIDIGRASFEGQAPALH